MSKLKESVASFASTHAAKDPVISKLFTALHSLRKANVSSMLYEALQPEQGDKHSKLLGFKQSYPVLCVADLFAPTSSLSNDIVCTTIREVMISTGALKGDLEEEEKNFQTSR